MFAETILSAVLAAAAALTPATKCPPPEGYPTAGRSASTLWGPW